MLNFKMSEFLKSDTAKKYDIFNYPTSLELDNLLNLIVYLMQPIRNLINKPIIITSGYRSKKLNTLVHGSINSQHLKGEAADFIVKNLLPSEIIKIIKKSDLEFDQLINEHNDWIHISYSKNNNRKQIIIKS